MTSKKPTKKSDGPRRALSIRFKFYRRLQNYCARNGRSVASYVEDLIAVDMDRVGEPIPTADEILGPSPPLLAMDTDPRAVTVDEGDIELRQYMTL